MNFRIHLLDGFLRSLVYAVYKSDAFQNLVISAFSLRRRAISLPYLDRIYSSLVRYHDDLDQARRFMYSTNTSHLADIKDVDLLLISRAIEFNYLSWPRKIFSYVYGKDVLDVGCGTGLHALGYVVAGVNSYTGLDPKINLVSDIGKNLRNRQWEHFGWTPLDIMRKVPHVRFIPGTFETIAPEVTFDIVVLHNVTEHLHNLEDVFKGIVKRLRPDGRILYNHHNFFCWNGHHKMPKSLTDIDLENPTHRKYIDWGHVAFAESHTDELSKKLNKIRMDDLRRLTEKYYSVEIWREIPSNPEQGCLRFTNEILEKYPEYEKREFMIQNVFCVARSKFPQGGSSLQNSEGCGVLRCKSRRPGKLD